MAVRLRAIVWRKEWRRHTTTASAKDKYIREKKRNAVCLDIYTAVRVQLIIVLQATLDKNDVRFPRNWCPCYKVDCNKDNDIHSAQRMLQSCHVARNDAPYWVSNCDKLGQKISLRLPTTSQRVIFSSLCQSLLMMKLCSLAHVVRIRLDVAREVSSGFWIILHLTEYCPNACSMQILSWLRKKL